MIDHLLYLEIGASFAFGVSGALVALRKQMDLFGIVVLAAVTSSGGGVIRDLMLGVHPPGILQDSRFLLTGMGAGIVTFIIRKHINKFIRPIEWMDMVGVAIFALSGFQTGRHHNLGLLACAILGLFSSLGGGVMRDMFAGRVPYIFRKELYATCTVLGLVIFYLLEGILPLKINFWLSAVFIMATRYLTLSRGWSLPAQK